MQTLYYDEWDEVYYSPADSFAESLLDTACEILNLDRVSESEIPKDAEIIEVKELDVVTMLADDEYQLVGELGDTLVFWKYPHFLCRYRYSTDHSFSVIDIEDPDDIADILELDPPTNISDDILYILTNEIEPRVMKTALELIFGDKCTEYTIDALDRVVRAKFRNSPEEEILYLVM